MSALPVVNSGVPVLAPPRPAAAGAGHSESAAREARPIQAVARIIDLREETQARRARREAAHDSRRQDRERPQSPSVYASPTAGAARPLDPASVASAHFLTQMLNQASDGSGGRLAGHRDGPLLSSDAYRRAGAQPALYGADPRVVRIVA